MPDNKNRLILSSILKLKSVLFFFKSFLPKPKPVVIYTDGSHKGKWGAWAFVIVKNNKIIHEASGRERRTSSLRMEFQAAIEALSYVPAGSWVQLYTDSKILVDCAVQDDRPLANEDQTEILAQLIQLNRIQWNWVRAHSGNPYNERCDELCIQARS